MQVKIIAKVNTRQIYIQNMKVQLLSVFSHSPVAWKISSGHLYVQRQKADDLP